MMDVSYSDGPLNTYVDDYRRMRFSNDSSLDTPVTLSSLCVIDLDTSRMSLVTWLLIPGGR